MLPIAALLLTISLERCWLHVANRPQNPKLQLQICFKCVQCYFCNEFGTGQRQVTLLARLSLVSLVSTKLKVDGHLVHIKDP